MVGTIEYAAERSVPAAVYATSTGVRGRIESMLFTPYRYLLKLRS